MAETMIVTVRLPKTLVRVVDNRALQESGNGVVLTRSDIFRKAIRKYMREPVAKGE